MAPAVSDLIDIYQPDWVFVPILDKGVGPARWVHTRAYELSGRSRARFVIACSLSLAERSGDPEYPNTPVALLIGPQAVSGSESAAGATGRAFAAASCTEHNPRCGKVQWNHRAAPWKKTSLDAM
jgi:hypothetical protein